MYKVLISSLCTKKALKKTRRIIDGYGIRVGAKVWIAELTAEGLETLKTLLRQTARKNTSVACFIFTQKGINLFWQIGSRHKISEKGVGIMRTTKQEKSMSLLNEHHIQNRPISLLYTIVQYATQFHDIGKANPIFQEKIKKAAKTADVVRHEIMSILFLQQDLSIPFNERWEKSIDLAKHLKNTTPFKEILKNMPESSAIHDKNIFQAKDIGDWLIATHHRLPKYDQTANAMSHVLEGDFAKLTKETQFSFPQEAFNNFLKSEDLLTKITDTETCLGLFIYGRLAFMLSDHTGSGVMDPDFTKKEVLANGRQRLSFHLDQVFSNATHAVKFVTNRGNGLFNRPALSLSRENRINMERKSENKRFFWQNDVATEAEEIIRNKDFSNMGKFICLAAATGSGKTKMGGRLLSIFGGENLRACVVNGLRSLTLQTGMAYRKEFNLNENEVATIIGDYTAKALFDKQQTNEKKIFSGTESIDESLETEVKTTWVVFFENLFPKIVRSDLKNNQGYFSQDKATLLGAPVLISTIDYLMDATNWSRGGGTLAKLRLLTSDVLLDEIDSYDLKDYPAIGRLLFLIGLFGRTVILSSATLSPEIATPLYTAYQKGWSIYAKLFDKQESVVSLFCSDLINPEKKKIKSVKEFEESYENYSNLIANAISSQNVSRRAKILPITKNDEYIKAFELIKDEVFNLHNNVAEKSGNNIFASVGLIRTVRIPDCVSLAYDLARQHETLLEQGIYMKVIPYHAGLLLAVRNHTERELDKLLTRKNVDPFLCSDFVKEAEMANCKNAILVIVATPVEEVGRDHDFDWAIVDPSSTRSIVQIAGRVRRHRPSFLSPEQYNMSIMNLPFRALRTENGLVYTKPGFESIENRFKFYEIENILPETIMSVNSRHLLAKISQNCGTIDQLPYWERKNIKNNLLQTTAIPFTNDLVRTLFTSKHVDEHRFRFSEAREKQEVYYNLESKIFEDSRGVMLEDICLFPNGFNLAGFYFKNICIGSLVEDLCNSNIEKKTLLGTTRLKYMDKDTFFGDPLLGISRSSKELTKILGF